MRNSVNITRQIVILALAAIVLGSSMALLAHAGGRSTSTLPTIEPPPPANGKIAFTYFDFPNAEQIATVNEDGSELTLLTSPSSNNEDPVFSPDGSQIAFSSVQAIWIMNRDGSQVHPVPNTGGSPNATNPIWSPDGSKIAFSRDYKIWVINVDGTNGTQLSDGTTSDDFAAWSPDGSKIAFVKDYFSANAQIYVMNTDGSNPVNLTNSSFACRHPAWSPDGSKIAYDSSSQIFTMNPDGTNQTQISTTPYVYFNEDPDWSPDGSRIVFTSHRDNNAQIYVMNADGSNEARVTNNPAQDDRPSWGHVPPAPTPTPTPFANLFVSAGIDLLAANGSTVTHTASVFNGGPDMALNAKITFQIPVGATFDTATNPYGSCSASPPDGNGTLVTCTLGDIAQYDSRLISHTATVTGAPYAVLTFTSTVSSDSVDSYPDSNVSSVLVQIAGPPVPTPTPATGDNPVIAFETRRDGNSEIYTRRADGSAQTNLTNDPADDDSFAWSPDGSKLAFSRLVDVNNNNRELFVMNADGTNQARITNSTDDQDADPVWSPDGTKLLFTSQSNLSNTRALWVTNADGSNQTRIGVAAYDYDSDPSWSPDSTKILYIRDYFDGINPTVRSIYTANAAGTNRTRLSPTGVSDYTPTWSPDGAKIRFLSVQPGINNTTLVDVYTMNADGTSLQNLTNLGNVFLVAPAWSPDGSKVAFISGNTGNQDVFVMNADGSGRVTVFHANDYTGLSGWSPDSTKLLISTTFIQGFGAGIHVVNADGSGSVHFGGDAEYNRTPDWSPDSTRIVFTSRRAGNTVIDIINSDGTGRVALTTETSYYAHPKWQPRPQGNTPAGTNINVTANGASVTFSNVTTAGETTITPIDPNSLTGVPGEYVINANSLAFEIHATAVYTGPITIGFQVPGVNNPITFSALRVLHGEPPPVPNFVDRTVLSPDTPAPNFASRTIYARVTSLSPFIILERADITPPSITITSPTASVYLLNRGVTASFQCTDTGSGVATCTGSATNGAPLNTTLVGAKTFTVNATDVSGNTAQQSVSYKISYGVSPLFDQTKANKSGGTIPVKLELVDVAGVNRSASNIVVTATAVTRLSNNAPGALQDPGNSNPDYNFRFTGGQYQYNLKTTGYATGTYRLDFQVTGDPITHSVQFQIK